MTLTELLERFADARRAGSGYSAKCPGHEDGKASLSISEGDDGRILLHCHAGCEVKKIVEALGLSMRDLMPAKVSTKSRIVATYDYRDEKGVLLFQAVRYDPKNFKQRRPDGNGKWIWDLNGTPRVLYHLAHLQQADPAEWVLIAEGEKDVDSLRYLTLIATCNPMGANKWDKLSDDSVLHGRRVAILPDRDDAGRSHALDVARRLHGKAAEIRIVDLPTTLKDASDFINARRRDGKTDQEIRAEIMHAVEKTTVFAPTATQALPISSDTIRLSELADRFIAEEIRPVWHRESRTLYSEKQDREIPIISLWHSITDVWVDAVLNTTEAAESKRPPVYRSRLALLRDAVLMAAGRAVRSLPEYKATEVDIETDRDELLSRLVAWLTAPRQFRGDTVTIAGTFWSWACGLAPGEGWSQCYAFAVYGRILEGAVTVELAVRGEYLSGEFRRTRRKLAAILRQMGLADPDYTLKVTGATFRAWRFTPDVIAALGVPDASLGVTRVTEKPHSCLCECGKDDPVTVTHTRVCERGNDHE